MVVEGYGSDASSISICGSWLIERGTVVYRLIDKGRGIR